MKTKILSFFICLVMVMSMGTHAFAADEQFDVLTEFDLMNQLNDLNFGEHVSFFPLVQVNDKVSSVNPVNGELIQVNANELLQFDSVEDFEKFMIEILTPVNNLNSETIYLNLCDTFPENISDRGLVFHNVHNNVAWWGGGNTSLLSMTNARLRFTLTDGAAGMTVSNIQVLDSWMTGISAQWTHTSGHASPTGGTNARVTVNGRWTILIAIGLFPAGITINETINSPNIRIA